MKVHERFRMSDPEILGVDASWEDPREPRANWYVSYAPELEEDAQGRVLLATLHVVGKSSSGSIRLAALLHDSLDGGDPEAFESDLAASNALNTLYAFARSGLRTVFAVVGVDAEVPEESPGPEIDQLVRSEEAKDESE